MEGVFRIANVMHQFYAYNEYLSILVTVPSDSLGYAEGFAKRVAMDFYDYMEDQVEKVNIELITSFWMESAVNLNILSKL